MRPRDVNCLALSGDGRLLATGSHTGVIRLWDLATGQEKVAALLDSKIVRPLPSGTAGKTLAVFSGGGLHSWDLERPARAETPWRVRERPGQASELGRVLVLSPDGKTAVTGRLSGSLYLMDVGKGTALHQLEGDSDFAGVAFAPDGRTLATMSSVTRSRCGTPPAVNRSGSSKHSQHRLRLLPFRRMENLSLCWWGVEEAAPLLLGSGNRQGTAPLETGSRRSVSPQHTPRSLSHPLAKSCW